MSELNGRIVRAVFMSLLLIYPLLLNAQKKEIYLDEKAPLHDRVTDLLSRLTIEEKISLLTATSPGISRLGIPHYYHGNEALHGVVRPGRFTVFPQAIGMASMWNLELHYRIATAISDEARARWNELDGGKQQNMQFSDLLTFWSPTVNMARDPRWGRTPETYGEDPYLSGVLGAAFVKGLQGNDPRYLKVVSTPKHFAANNEEHNRFVCNPRISEKQLREYYFPAFEMTVKEGKAASFMSAYNAINDVPCTANPWLLNKVLREDWGFDGYVVSDCGGPSLLVSAHKYVKTKEAAATLCIKAGLDLECGDDVYRQPLINAYYQNMVSDEEIDHAAYRVLMARMRLGLFDDLSLNPYNRLLPGVVGSEAHKELALESARQSIVLLKNAKNTLPVNTQKVKSIAVVGINAGNSEFGDYSGAPVNEPVSILEGIRRRAGENIQIVYAPWKSAKDGMELLQGDCFPEGLQVEYFDNVELKGTPVVRKEDWINFEPANQAPDPFLPKSPLSIRWTGKLKPVVSGRYTFSLMSDEGVRLILDGKTLIDAWEGHAIRIDTVAVDLVAGQTYDIRTEYWDNRDYAVCRLQWRVPEAAKKERIDMYGEAGNAARNCDMVVAVMGINKSIEREGQDRYDIHLPADQQEFIEEIYKINPNTVVVLVAGSSLAVNWMEEHIPAIVNAWYPGEQGGTAVAEVLFGDYNPAGRLPLTYYNSLDELPPFDDYDIVKGRTYQYFKGKPLYPFGYGLSYTTFSYSNLTIEDKGDEVTVSFRIKNTGKKDGDEVAQLYVKLPHDNAPAKELKGFRRTHIRKGETTEVKIDVKKEQLRYWDEQKERFITPAGVYKFMVGSSSADIRLTQEKQLAPVPQPLQAGKTEWVTSTAEASWQLRNTQKIQWQKGDAPTRIELNNTLQTIEGFGTCFNELGWTSLGLLSEYDRSTIMRELFTPGYGANFTICRMPVGANDFSRNWYSYNETEGDFEMKNFSISNDQETLIPFIKEAQKYNPDVKIWASPWSPPTWMKYNKHYACAVSDANLAQQYRNDLTADKQGAEGTNMFIQEDQYFKAYALYFTNFIEAYRKEGIPISMVMPQNEFNSCQNFPSCTWTAAGINKFVGEYLGPAMKNIGVELMFGTMERANSLLTDTLLRDKRSSRYIQGVGFQWAGKGAVGKVHTDYPALKIYQTEQECGNGKNDWEYCCYAWDLMKHYLSNGTNVYTYWNTSLEEGGISRWGWSQNSLVTVNPANKTYKYNYEYYLMKHFSHYVLPGAKRLAVSGEFDNMLAFKNTDGSIVLVMQNRENQPVTPKVKIGEDVISFTLEPQSFSTIVVNL